MVEIELKFQVPERRQAAVLRAVATGSAQTTRLQAQYFDSADRRLARNAIALRLRQENGRWVQTLKAPGAAGIQRLEHEVVLGAGPPRIELSRHAGTAVGKLLLDALGDAPLLEIFATDVVRTHRLVRSGATQIEIACDVGELLAAGGARQAICELELEWKSGPLSGLFSLAQRWAKGHGLWLDVRSKSERGELLARGAAASPASKASCPALRKEMGRDAALRAIVATCLKQLLPNLSALAAETGDASHLHQARIGLRRLRTALKVFKTWSPALDPGWEPTLGALFTQLGSQRDQDALGAALLPALMAAGAPLATLADLPSATSIGPTLRAPVQVQTWLALLAFALDTGGEESPAGVALKKSAATVLADQHRRVNKAARHFEAMDDEARHQLRKRLKRLRYSTELLASLFAAKKVKKQLEILRPAQEALGHYNDLCVAEALFRHLAETDPRAWFAVGWLVAQRDAQVAVAAATLRDARD